MRSASARVLLTCLFLTLSVVDLHSLCLSRMCLRRTWEGSSVFRRFAGGGSEDGPRTAAGCCEAVELLVGSLPGLISVKATTDARLASFPTCPNHCTAASTRAPAAMRGRPALLLKIVDSAALPPMEA